MSAVLRTRHLRHRLLSPISAALAICLAVGGVVLVVTPSAFSVMDEGPALTLRSPQIPWAAVNQGTGTRLEKQGQAARISFQKPSRRSLAKVTELRQTQGQRPWAVSSFRYLPRQMLSDQRLSLLSSDDSGDPYHS